MPRPQRICFPGALYHVYQRGNYKQDIFLDDIDRRFFLRLLIQAKQDFDFILYCYVLMKNHFHITVETPNAVSISKIMFFVEANYARYFNKRHEFKGHLFQGRFGDILVEKDAYLLELSRYVHLNPVRANLVTNPELYSWSSYNTYIGSQKDPLIDVGMVLSYFSDSVGDSAASVHYKKFVEEGLRIENNSKDWLEENLIRKRFLGTTDFVKNFQKRCQAPFNIDGEEAV